jgi:hypothetical protein
MEVVGKMVVVAQCQPVHEIRVQGKKFGMDPLVPEQSGQHVRLVGNQRYVKNRADVPWLSGRGRRQPVCSQAGPANTSGKNRKNCPQVLCHAGFAGRREIT